MLDTVSAIVIGSAITGVGGMCRFAYKDPEIFRDVGWWISLVAFGAMLLVYSYYQGQVKAFGEISALPTIVLTGIIICMAVLLAFARYVSEKRTRRSKDNEGRE